MMGRRRLAFLAPSAVLLGALLSACAHTAQRPSSDALRAEVIATERAFAATMAARDFAAFGRFLAPEAVFFDGDKPIEGAAAVRTAWQPLFAGPAAPFSWEPTTVVVLATGDLAHSSGPVRAPDGRIVAQFNSVWRRMAPGRWQIVFDKGCRACACKDKP